MNIGLYIRLFGRPGTEPPPPSWSAILRQAQAAERAGFDRLVLEDVLLYPDEEGNLGVWEAVSVAAGLAAVMSKIGLAHAVLNSPYRYPGLVASIANTLDEISGGRYTLGIGAGNTPDDYPLFGIEADPRFGRFAEAIEIIHGLLKTGRTTLEGRYYRVADAELALRGPRPEGPPIAIAAGKPRMMRLAARYADEWNWWTRGITQELREQVAELERACGEVGRDPASLRRSIDVFSVVAEGSADGVAEALLAYGDLGFDEVRVNLTARDGDSQLDAIGWMEDVVSRVHAN